MHGASKKASLTIVGTGIKLGQHLTKESQYAITNAKKVFAVVTDSATFHWLKTLNPNIESLQVYYDKDKDRIDSYQQMVDTITKSVIDGFETCAIFYGHPGIFVYPSHAAIEKLNKLGYSTKMLPGISADACLFADLGVDPASDGCQSFEATDFLLYSRKLDPTVATVLWQIGVIGEFKGKGVCNNDVRFQVFVDELEKTYSKEHQVTIYEAAQYGIFEPKLITTTIGELRGASISPISTLFIPPEKTKRINHEIAKLFEIDTSSAH